jgi:two-component system chemotaxis response regulator CheB
MDKIKVLIVEDSPVATNILTAIINSDEKLTVIGTAKNGKEGVDLTKQLKPDIITMDIHMPIMDGYEATKQIMAYTPTPIIVVSSSTLQKDSNKVFHATSYGALDVINKDLLSVDGISGQEFIKQFLDKLKLFSKIKVLTHMLGKIEHQKQAVSMQYPGILGTTKIVGIAVSVGGPQALQNLLNKIPKNFSSSILIVQHISEGFAEGLVDWLSNSSRTNIKIPKNNEKIESGVVYIAPSGVHMKVSERGTIILSDDPPYLGFRPSCNILLESIASVYKNKSVGVILTGMGSDGALGMKAIKAKGGITIAQDEKTSIVFGMPKVAIDMGVIDKILPLEKIADELIRIINNE